jgi:pimeloyl-ACP methyl ester carboxylesterase
MRVPLVLLPGMDGTGRLFAALVASLPAGVAPRVIAHPSDESLGYAELLERVRPRCPRHERWFVLGESFSGPLALRLAAERPPGLAGVVLAASFVASPVRWAPRWLVRPGLFSGVTRRLAGRVLGTGDGGAALQAEFVAANASVAPAVLARRAREILGVELQGLATALAEVPVLTLAARRDRVLGRGDVAAIQRLLPHAEVRWFDAPHLLLQTRASEAAAAIAAFMRV